MQRAGTPERRHLFGREVLPVAEQHGGQERCRRTAQVQNEPLHPAANRRPQRGRGRRVVRQRHLRPAAAHRMRSRRAGVQRHVVGRHAPAAVATRNARLRYGYDCFEVGAGVRGHPGRTDPIYQDAVAGAGADPPIVGGQDAAQLIDLVQRQTGTGGGGAQAGAEFGARGERQAGRRGQQQAAPPWAGRQCQAGGGEREPRTCEQ